MKIVQAFNQQGREAERFTNATETVFTTAKRRILLRALMTAIVIALMFSAITWVIWQGAIDVAAGRMTGGTIAAFVLYGGLLAGAFGALERSLWRPAARRRRVGTAERAAQRRAGRSRRRPTRCRCPYPPRAAWSFDDVDFRYPTRPDISALARLHLDGPAQRDGSRWSARRARARPPSSSSPSASTTRRPAASCSTAST